jgi:hypothetical protein
VGKLLGATDWAVAGDEGRILWRYNHAVAELRMHQESDSKIQVVFTGAHLVGERKMTIEVADWEQKTIKAAAAEIFDWIERAGVPPPDHEDT